MPTASQANEKWYEGSFRNLNNYGVIGKVNNPDALIKREEAANYISNSLVKVLGKDMNNSGKNFSDIYSIKPNLVSSVQNAASYGIMVGDPSGAFRPKSTLTRAEAAQIISNLDNANKVSDNKKEEDKKEENKIKIYTDLKSAKDAITNNILNGEKEFEIGINIKEINNNIDYLFDNLDNRILSAFSYRVISKKDNEIIHFTTKPSDELESLHEEQKYIKDWVKNNINSSMSDEEKVKTIHDFIVNKKDYNIEALRSGYDIDSKGYNIYTPGAILFGDGGVCQAYAFLFQNLPEEAGLDTKLVIGTADNTREVGGHVWNIVKVNGTWYHIDTTWDDPESHDGRSILRYKYYLKSDDYMSHNHKWDRTRLPSCPENYPQNYYSDDERNYVYFDNYNNKTNEFDTDKQNNNLDYGEKNQILYYIDSEGVKYYVDANTDPDRVKRLAESQRKIDQQMEEKIGKQGEQIQNQKEETDSSNSKIYGTNDSEDLKKPLKELINKSPKEN